MRKQKYLPISMLLILALVLAYLATGVSARPLAATAPGLGTAGSYAVLGGSTVTNTGPSVLNGSLGAWPGLAITGFPPGIVVPPGTTHNGDAAAQQAQSDITAAYNALESQACDTDLTGQDLGGLTLTPGVYCYNAAAQLTGALTLNGQGNPNAVFVFKIGSALTTASGSSVVMINSGSACNVFWKVTSSATLGTTTSFLGNLIALQSITVNTGANIRSGRALARNGAVTLDTNNVSVTACTISVLPTWTPLPETPAAIATNTRQPTWTPLPETQAAIATNTRLPAVSGLPSTGAAPIQDQNFPWTPVVLVGLSAIALAFGIRAIRKADRSK